MLRFIFAVSLSVFAIRADAQPTVEWIASGGGEKNDKTRAICFDRLGNVFLAGEMTGDGKFGELDIKSGGGVDFFLTKVDAAGKFLWARNLGGGKTDRGYGVATDASGNAYVTGHFESADAIVNGAALPNAGDYDIFVAKYDPDGKLLWVRTAGGTGYDYGHGIAVDDNGAVVISGAIVGQAKFGNITANAEGRAIFCAKYTANGDAVWVTTTTGKVSGSGHGIAVDGLGHIYVGGAMTGEGMFGKETVSGAGAFAAKLSTDGAVLWVTNIAGGGAHEIAADAQGRVWLAGMFKGEMSAGQTTYSSTGAKDNDGFIAHISREGEVKWVHAIQSPAVDYCLGVTTDGNGTAFVCGEFSSKATFAGQTLTSRGGTDVQIGAFDQSGKLLWLTQVGGVKGDNAYTMACHRDGTLAIGGAFTGPSAFDKVQAGSTRAADMYGLKMRMK